MSRAKPLPWIPTAINFSSLQNYRREDSPDDEEFIPNFTTDDGVVAVEDFYPEGWVESVILEMLSECQDDTQRVLLLVLIVKESGYNLEHSEIAKALSLNERAYYRRLKNMRQTLKKSDPRSSG